MDCFAVCVLYKPSGRKEEYTPKGSTYKHIFPMRIWESRKHLAVRLLSRYPEVFSSSTHPLKENCFASSSID